MNGWPGALSGLGLDSGDALDSARPVGTGSVSLVKGFGKWSVASFTKVSVVGLRSVHFAPQLHVTFSGPRCSEAKRYMPPPGPDLLPPVGCRTLLVEVRWSLVFVASHRFTVHLDNT